MDSSNDGSAGSTSSESDHNSRGPDSSHEDGQTSSHGRISDRTGTDSGQDDCSHEDGQTSSDKDSLISSEEDDSSLVEPGRSDASSGEDDGQTSSSDSDSSGVSPPSVPHREVWELCCGPCSRITNEALKLGLKARRLTLETNYNFAKESCRQRTMKEAWRKKP